MQTLDNFRTKLTQPCLVQLSRQMHYDQFATTVSSHILSLWRHPHPKLILTSSSRHGALQLSSYSWFCFTFKALCVALSLICSLLFRPCCTCRTVHFLLISSEVLIYTHLHKHEWICIYKTEMGVHVEGYYPCFTLCSKGGEGKVEIQMI